MASYARDGGAEPKASRAAETPTWRAPMQSIRKMIRTLAMAATVDGALTPA
jgi:hypothetical protein